MKNIGLIGCGNIAETYFRAQDYFNNIKFIACADKFPEASKKCAEQYKIKSLTLVKYLYFFFGLIKSKYSLGGKQIIDVTGHNFNIIQ